MRSLIVGLALALGVAVPQCAADGPAGPQSSPTLIRMAANSQLPALLKRLEINPISKAVAAQCEEEGENCTSNAQCCSGLECIGAPHATCMPAD
jgi:hypothetical protein